MGLVVFDDFKRHYQQLNKLLELDSWRFESSQVKYIEILLVAQLDRAKCLGSFSSCLCRWGVKPSVLNVSTTALCGVIVSHMPSLSGGAIEQPLAVQVRVLSQSAHLKERLP